MCCVTVMRTWFLCLCAAYVNKQTTAAAQTSRERERERVRAADAGSVDLFKMRHFLI